ncbi:dihydroneopterin aldolase [Helicobacter sp. MIT 21-1697]|uniref:dihydroneopterin aldolase n=1 Tax=Helicobacter sp. MIT 21-1697 TaxID=2993733 RepID=UPI00224B50DB|nr:dihydroneopterin aldolase [Helicobacter sp. MIT 21-1697]MCX2716875.1 dihydroneopterin aldolase [Helicobacter sp. MIT 21-1697]
MEHITLHIENLLCEAIIGVLENERHTPQQLLVEAHITYMYKQEQYLDYTLISEMISHHLQINAYELLESALLGVIDELKTQFNVITRITLCIKKPQILAPLIVGASVTKTF